MLRTGFDFDWTFFRGKWEFIGFIPQSPAQIVNLPHDATIYGDPDPESPNGASTGYYNGCTACYTKTLQVPQDWRGQTVMLELDGAYCNAEVAVNGNIVARRPYGYAPFHADLTNALSFGGENEIRITADNSIDQNSRWYTGTGLYRHIDLLRGGPLHIKPWSLFARTESLSENGAAVVVEAVCRNTSAAPQSVQVHIELAGPDGGAAAADHTVLDIPPNSEQTALLRLWVPNAQLWSTEAPNLYTARCTLRQDSTQTDTDEASFGIRTLSLDAANGLRLNGRPLKLRGGCIHHDNGILGAAAFEAADHRKVRLHKQAGFNALRCAHNPPSRGLLNACDALGVLVMDEAFDMWNMPKKIHDYHMNFSDWWQRDLEAMVLRDRNHPSVILWSIGNEVGERAGDSEGGAWAHRLADTVRRLDPSRYVTAGMCGIFPPPAQLAKLEQQANEKSKSADMKDGAIQDFMDNNYVRDNFLPKTAAVCGALDVVGYNYLDFLYEATAQTFPNRVVCGTESFAFNIDHIWAMVEAMPHVIGDFCWVSWDHLGEAGIGKVSYHDAPPDGSFSDAHASPYPWRTTNSGDFDLLGFGRPQLHYRQIVWGSTQTYIAVRHPRSLGKYEKMSSWGWPDVQHGWNWPGHEGKPIAVDIYTRADEVELLLNGTPVGRQKLCSDSRCKARFELNYAPGTLEAVSYVAGSQVSRDRVETTGDATAVTLVAERTSLAADGQDLCFVAVELVDAAGRRVNCDTPLTTRVEGAASLAGFGSANPLTDENYTRGSFAAYGGRAMAILRAGRENGTAVLTVDAGPLGSATLEIQVS